MLFTYFNSRVVQTKRNVLETRGWQRDGGRVGADLDAARLLGRAEADGVPVGEENLVDGGVDLGADLGPVVASLAALGTDSIRKTYGLRFGLKNSDGTYSNS